MLAYTLVYHMISSEIWVTLSVSNRLFTTQSHRIVFLLWLWVSYGFQVKLVCERFLNQALKKLEESH